MNHRCCTICGKPIVLVPSATERARKYGETPRYYLNLFREHANCALRVRREETSALLRELEAARVKRWRYVPDGLPQRSAGSDGGAGPIAEEGRDA